MTTTPQVPGALTAMAISSFNCAVRAALHRYDIGTLDFAESLDAIEVALNTVRPEPAAAPAAGEPLTDDALRAKWRAAGGNFHGPNIETGTMPEAQLLPFLRALAAATPSVPQTHPGETDAYIDSVVQAADAHGRMRNPATQRSLDGAKLDLGRHLRRLAAATQRAGENK